MTPSRDVLAWTVRTALCVALIMAMYRVAASVHEHAWAQSHGDPGCVGICEPSSHVTVGGRTPRSPPAEFSRAVEVLLGGALCVSILVTHGLPLAARAKRAATLIVVHFLAICPLALDLSDWHGDLDSLLYVPLALASFPLNLFALPFMLSSEGVRFPYLGGDPIFGKFCTILAVNWVTLGASAYLQWFVVVPWLRTWVQRWKARRATPGAQTSP
jgi:peptidoglycan/LPS O-acetylase OafA/YrhL